MTRFIAILLLGLFASQATACDLDVTIPEIEGWEYREARSEIIAAGWQPKVFNHRFADNRLLPDQQLPEIAACSAEGFCRLQFADDGGHFLRVVTYGDGVRYVFPVCDDLD